MADPVTPLAPPDLDDGPSVPLWIRALGGRKKAAAIVGTLATTVVGGLFAFLKMEIPLIPDSIVAWVVPAVAALFVSVIVGQAYTDGQTGGATSAFPPPLAAVKAGIDGA